MSASTVSPELAASFPSEAPDLRKVGAHPDFWYPLYRSRKLKAAKAVGVRFAGEPIVLARTASGKLLALEDRCAHRQVPLHAGVVCGERLQCGYHGWLYGDDGRCVNIPYLDKGQALPNGVRSYPCREAYGLVFVFPGERAQASQAAFPAIDTYADPKYKTRFLDQEVACHYSFLHENLMDMNHQFLHRRIMSRIRTTFLDLREGDDWVEVDYTFSRVGKQPIGERFILHDQPGASDDRPKDLMTVRTQYPHQILKFWSAGSTHPALDLWITYVPVDREQRVNHTFGLINIRKPGIPGLIQLMWPFIHWFTQGIFDEDRWIVELEQAAFDAQGGDWNNEIFPVILKVRDLLRRKGLPIGQP